MYQTPRWKKKQPARQVSDDIFTVQLVIFVHILLKGFVLRIEKGLLTLQDLGKFWPAIIKKKVILLFMLQSKADRSILRQDCNGSTSGPCSGSVWICLELALLNSARCYNGNGSGSGSISHETNNIFYALIRIPDFSKVFLYQYPS